MTCRPTGFNVCVTQSELSGWSRSPAFILLLLLSVESSVNTSSAGSHTCLSPNTTSSMLDTWGDPLIRSCSSFSPRIHQLIDFCFINLKDFVPQLQLDRWHGNMYTWVAGFSFLLHVQPSNYRLPRNLGALCWKGYILQHDLSMLILEYAEAQCLQNKNMCNHTNSWGLDSIMLSATGKAYLSMSVKITLT